MPTFDEELRDRIRDAGPRAPSQDDLFEGLARRKRQRARARKVGTIVTVGVVLAGTLAAFLIADASRTGPKPVTEPTPTSSPTELGLPYPVCDVSTMPIGLGTTQGLAAVFTQATDGCPRRLEKDTFVGVGVDLNGDGILDATAGPIRDCFTLCEAFAAPDVNGDGIAEVAVSTAGADGYGIWLYAVSTSPPAIAQIADGAEPFGFPWVNVATHADAAHCETNGAGESTFVLDHSEWDASGSTVVQESYAISGVTATKLDQHRSSVTLEQTPTPTDELCGAPVYGSAKGSMGGPPRLEGRDIGLGTNVCDVARIGGLNLIPDAMPDAEFTGYLVDQNGRCPGNPERQRWIVAVDVTGDGDADASAPVGLVNCAYVSCFPLGATDLDGDGDEELVVTTGFSIHDEAYFSVGAVPTTIEPILVADPGHPAAEIQPGQPLHTSAGGDAGFGAWIRCEGYPASPVLVFTYGSGVVEGTQPTEWHEVKLQLQSDGMFHVIGTTDLSLPAGQDPGLVRSMAPACGLDFQGLSRAG